MKTEKTVTFEPGAELVLTPSQAKDRMHSLSYLGSGRYRVEAAVSFAESEGISAAEPRKLTAPAKTLAEYIRGLNVEDDTHWTKDGKPDLTVLSELTGRRVSRDEAESAAPGFKRPRG